jgi:hypothetical protein
MDLSTWLVNPGRNPGMLQDLLNKPSLLGLQVMGFGAVGYPDRLYIITINVGPTIKNIRPFIHLLSSINMIILAAKSQNDQSSFFLKVSSIRFSGILSGHC